jgi:PAS domain S-box-containing protein
MTANPTLKTVCEVRDSLTDASSREEVWRLTLESVGTFLTTDVCEVLTEECGQLVSKAASGTEEHDSLNESAVSPRVAERTYQSQQPVLIQDTTTDDRMATNTEYRSVLSVPLGQHGVLQLATSDPEDFDEQTLALVDVFGGYVTCVLDGLPSKTQQTPSIDQARTFLEIADVMMISLDTDGQITYTNRKAREILGYQEGELVGKDWFETCVPERSQDEVRDVFDQLMAGEIESVDRYENPVITADGNEQIIEWHNTVLRDETGNPTGTLSSGLDITARKESEQTLREEREKYSTIVEQFPNGLVTLFDEDFRYQIAGGTEFDQLDLSPDDLEGQRLEEVFPVENVEDLKPHYQQALEGKSTVIEQTLEDRVFRIHIVPVRDSEGEVIAGMTMSQDITERKERERELRQYKTIVESMHDPVIVFDTDYQIRFVNQRVTQDLGHSEEKLLGQSFDTFRDHFTHSADDQITTLREQLDKLLRGNKESVRAEVQFENDGREIIGDVKFVPFKVNGVIEGIVAIGRDITEQKEREQELEATKKRYQTLLQAAPDPIFVADAETGEIIEANTAAGELRGQPCEEIVGLHQSDLHPDREDSAYRRLFEEHVEEGGTRRQLPDGSPLYAVATDGELIPVEISVQTIELADGPVVYGIFRDISEQEEYERVLTTLNKTTRELFEIQTPQAVEEQIIETATTVLDSSGAAFYRFDDGEGVLRPTAHSPPSGVEDLLGDLPVFEPEESIAWRVFMDGDPIVFDDVRTDEDIYNPETPIRSELIAPVGEWGVLVVGDTQLAAFDDQADEIVEILCASAEAALKRVEREQHLWQREQELEQRAQQLEEVESINAQIRDIAQVIVNAETQQEIEQAVCTQLAETDSFEFAWIGNADPIEQRLTSRAQAGDDQGYFESISLSFEDDSTSEPAVQAIRTHGSITVANTAADMAQTPWRSAALRRGFQSAMSIPLVYQDTLHGVLTVYAETESAFDGVVQSVLIELGDLIAHGIAANKRKQALLSNRGTELEFNIRDRACFFLQFAQETNCTLELEGIIPQADESFLAFVRIQNGSSEQLLEEAERTPAIASTRRIESSNNPLIQLRFVEPFIASILAEQGLTVQNISADSSDCRVTVEAPPTFDLRQVADIVTTRYSDSELIAKREQSQSMKSTANLTEHVFERLTTRQREVAEMAYLSGYFESPRDMSSDELADELGFSVSAFHHHIRAAERKLFETVFENGSTNGFSHSDDSFPE